MMWRKFNVVINKKGMGTLMLKGIMVDTVQVKCCLDYSWDYRSYGQNERANMFIPLDFVF